MELIKEQIVNYFEKNKRYINAIDLKKKLNIKGEEQTDLFYDAIKALVEEGSLFFDSKKGYIPFTNDLGFAYGEIEINKAGNGFVHTKDGYTIFIDKGNLNGALNGDKVIISSIAFGRKESFNGEVYKVLKRKTGNIIFEVVGDGCNATLIPYNLNENVPVTIEKNELMDLKDGEYVLINIGTDKVDGEYVGSVIKTLGNKNDANIDIRLIYEKNDVPIEFSEDALAELKNIPNKVSEEEISLYFDLRDKDIVAIDCDETKDRDDAIYVEKLENGNFKLYTCISAVNHYIKEGSKLFEEAKERCNSYYPGGTCNPLFPPEISNGICSLNEGVDRIVKVCIMEITPSGEVVNYDFHNRAIIRSRKSMKYSEVNKILEGKDVEGYEPFRELLNLFKELNDALEKNRNDRQCIDFDLHDIEVSKDSSGKTKEFVTRGDGIAERIIENCMLVTGATVAEHYSWLPFIYRIQESPDTEIIQNTIKILNLSGFRFPNYNNIDETTINNIINRIKNKDEAEIVKKMILKSTKKAKYSTTNIGHFALQYKKYTHFTAPIRRISDFMIHVLIDKIETMDYSEESIKALEKELEMISGFASDKERLAKTIEEEVLAMEMAEYMQDHIGEKYEAIITEVYPHGIFVKTKDNISGKVKFENIANDKYRYDSDKRAAVGIKTKNKYQIGNRVYVIVKDACKETRTINFAIEEKKKIKKV